MPASSRPGNTPALFRALLQAKLLTKVQVQELTAVMDDTTPAIDILLSRGMIDDVTLAQFFFDTFGYPLVDITTYSPDFLAKQLASMPPGPVLYAIPLKAEKNRMRVAVSDPTNQQLLDKLRFQAQIPVDPVIITHSSLLAVLRQHTQAELPDYKVSAAEKASAKPRATPARKKIKAEYAPEADSDDDVPVVNFLQELLMQAVAAKASDLHFEPYEHYYRIRFRIDGALHEVSQPPVVVKDKVASRIKILSGLDIAEKRVPQDGRMQLAISATDSIDFRVSTLPTLFGEKIVMRLLDSSQAQIGIDSLGFTPTQKELILKAIHRPYGMIIVTGPTGSGKTVSLYTFLNILNQPGTNISSAEDPAEINLPGINQVNINERAGLTFPVALRAFLRQDPDIIMVGEIRDLKTADIAVKAAQTGHLVFSTLHTNDAPSTLTRLVNMGIPTFNVASSINMITAQRLARKLCDCKQPANLPDSALLDAGFTQQDIAAGLTTYKPVGCDVCNGSGYKGRVGIHQVMMVSEEIERIILDHGTTVDIATQAHKEGMLTLRQAGLVKVREGITSLEEIISTTNIGTNN